MIYPLQAAKTALLVVDAQNEYFLPDGALFTPHAAEIEVNLGRLVEGFRAAGGLVVFIRHVVAANGEDAGRMADFDDGSAFVDGTPGIEIVASLVPREDEPIVDKTRYSSFVNTRLESVLKTAGVDTVVVTGLMTQFCCTTTARHAHDLDYRTLFVSDANAGPDMPDLGFGPVPHAQTMAVIGSALSIGVAEVVDTGEILSRLNVG